MKISFSTLGCPGWSFEDILAVAKDFGFDGIEVRGIKNELYIPKALPFTDTHLRHTIDRLNELNLKIPCLTSSSFLFDKSGIDTYLQEARDCIDLAQKIGTPFVRVLGDRNPEPKDEIDVDFVAKNLAVLASYAESRNVEVLVETNGTFAESRKMAALMARFKGSGIGVLWDIHHPFRYFNEPVEKTYGELKDYIRLVHMKDSVVEDGKVKYRMMGYGDVPVKEALLLLRKNGYTGYISLEWVKRWCMDLEEPGVVFSHFINWVRMAME